MELKDKTTVELLEIAKDIVTELQQRALHEWAKGETKAEASSETGGERPADPPKNP